MDSHGKGEMAHIHFYSLPSREVVGMLQRKRVVSSQVKLWLPVRLLTFVSQAPPLGSAQQQTWGQLCSWLEEFKNWGLVTEGPPHKSDPT